MYRYKTEGTCSKHINIELNGDTISNIAFEGGCQGNLKAMERLLQGKTIDETAEVLEGLTCGPRNTSCGDQLVKGLREARKAQSSSE